MANSKFNFDPTSSLEVPAAIRDMAERGLDQAKDAFERLKTAADETSTTVGNTYSVASKGAASLGGRVLDAARANVNAGFDHALALLNVKSFSDAVELQTAFLRERTEAFTKESRDIGQLAQQVLTDVAAPAKAGFEKVIRFPG